MTSFKRRINLTIYLNIQSCVLTQLLVISGKVLFLTSGLHSVIYTSRMKIGEFLFKAKKNSGDLFFCNQSICYESIEKYNFTECTCTST